MTIRDEAAKRAYYASTDNHPTIHCNRFPLWEELSEETKKEWCRKVAR